MTTLKQLKVIRTEINSARYYAEESFNHTESINILKTVDDMIEDLLSHISKELTFPLVYTTGAYLRPIELPSGGFGWIVKSFEEDTYFDEKEMIINSWAEDVEGLIEEKEK